MDWWTFASTVLSGFVPVLPHFAGIIAFLIVLQAPVPGRGPRRSQGRDPWRRFKYESRRVVMERAGNRCEGAVFLAWGLSRARRRSRPRLPVVPWRSHDRQQRAVPVPRPQPP